MNRVIKTILESILLYAGPAHIGRLLVRGRGVILSYHNIQPDRRPAGGDRSLHLPQEDFARQLDVLSRTCDVVPVTAFFANGEPSGRPRVAITFDDAYLGAVSVGAAELELRRLPATYFVAPGCLGGIGFWWDCMPLEGVGEDGAIREYALTECQGKQERVLQWFASRRISPRETDASARTASVQELSQLARVPGMTFGSHSWSHPNLTTLSDEELSAELRSSLTWLQERFANVLPYLSYPYGRTDARVAAAAQTAGYVAGLRVAGGWLPSKPQLFDLPRLNIPAGVSIGGFSIRVSGLGRQENVNSSNMQHSYR